MDKVASAQTVKTLDNDINQMSDKVTGKNLIDPEYITIGKRIGVSADNFHVIDDPLGIITGYIKVKPGTQYMRIGGYGSGILVEKLGDTVPVRVVSGVIFTPSIGENYFLTNISIEGDVERINSAIVWDYSLTTDETYEPYWSERKIKDSSLPEGLIREDDWNKITTIVRSKNLFDKNAIQNGMWLNPTILENIGTRITSDYIPVTEGKSYKIGNLPVSTTRQVGGFAKRGDKVPLWYVDSKVNSPVGSFTVPTGLGIKFIVFNIATTAPSQHLDNIQLEEGLTTTSYVPFSEKLMIREEVLPEITPPSDTDTDLMYSEAMRDMKKTNEANQNENLSRLRTIRGIKNSDSGQISFTVNNNSGADISNVLLPVYLHSGDNEITPHERHIFLSDNSQNLSDVRFLDSDGNFMNFYCPSKGNYELLVDDRIKDFVWADNDGILLMCDRTNIFKSTDNLETVELIKPGYMAGINQLGDIFYKTSETGTQILYKSTKASNYTDEIAVLDTGFPTRFSPMAFKMTDEGVMFAGCYQDNYNALIWRSVNNGNSWTLSLNQSSRQHVHSIVIDRNTSPNTVYANIDGNIIEANTDSQMACYRTTNSGVSWERLSLPFLTDYGVLYTGDDFTIGGGEGAVKATPTIWKRNKATGDISIKVDTLQNSPKSYRNNNAILISGGGHTFNGTPKIYRSIDKGETFKEIFTAPFRNTSVMNYSWRYGSGEEALLPTGSLEEQNFITCNYTLVGNYNLRYFEGGDHYMGLFYVKISLLKSGINNFSVGYGYASEDIQEQVFERPELPIFEMGMNEKTPYIFDNIDNNYKVSPGAFDVTD
ncbi:MAG: hypothetical protein KBT36_09795, partial [Kurthia sp.]|nr:hypothetical protein [Candidatus Kurthia equi]